MGFCTRICQSYYEEDSEIPVLSILLVAFKMPEQLVTRVANKASDEIKELLRKWIAKAKTGDILRMDDFFLIYHGDVYPHVEEIQYVNNPSYELQKVDKQQLTGRDRPHKKKRKK